jgi:hypothetical protein
MNSPVEQSKTSTGDCGHHDGEHDCHGHHHEQEISLAPKLRHEPEGVFSKIVGFMDIAGVFASTLCTIHCILLPLVMALLPVLARPIMEHDFVHVGLAGFVLVFCLMAYIPGYLSHRDKRLIWIGAAGLTLVFFATFVARFWGEIAEGVIITMGNTVIIFGHMLNRRLLAHAKCKHSH